MRHDAASRRGRALVLAGILWSAGLGAAAEANPGLGLLGLRFEPPNPRVGERVTARLLLGEGPEQLEPLLLRGPAQLGGLSDSPLYDLEELRLARSGSSWEYSLSFVPWAPGPGDFPSLLVKGHTLPGFAYTVSPSAGAEDRLPGPRRPQADPPGAAFYLYAGLGLLGLLALLVLGFFLWILPGALALRAAWRSRAALRRFHGTLSWLEESCEGGDGRAWYGLLARSLRLYLSARLLPEALALTPEEFRGLASPGARAGEAVSAAREAGGGSSEGPREGGEDEEGVAAEAALGLRAAELLGRADEVRFGEAPTAAADRREAALGARDLARLVEELRQGGGWEAGHARP